MMLRLALAVSAAAVCAYSPSAQIPAPKEKQEGLSKLYTGKSYSPYAGQDFPRRPLWGDTHLHTGYSLDAGAFGCRLSPEDSYRFARGEEITASAGMPVRLSRPLDTVDPAEMEAVWQRYLRDT